MDKRPDILYEATPAVAAKRSGVGYYTEHLLSSLIQFAGSRYTTIPFFFNFLGKNAINSPAVVQNDNYQIKYFPGRALSLLRRLRLTIPFSFLVRHRADIVLFTNYVALPVASRTKVALIVYDLSFLDHPEFTEPKNLLYLKKFCIPSIDRADVLITISEFSRQRLLHFFPEASHKKIVVTPIPPPPLPRSLQNLNLQDRLVHKGIQKKGYILFVSTIEPRKNISRLIEAYQLLPQPIRSQYSLVLVGGKGWQDQEISGRIKSALAAHYSIILTGYVSEEEKNALYANAACFIMPSIYEGFGMPILESMQHATPCAVSDIDVFREVAGSGAVFFDPYSPRDIADKVAQLLTNKGLQQEITTHYSHELEKYSWEKNIWALRAEFDDLLQPAERVS